MIYDVTIVYVRMAERIIHLNQGFEGEKPIEMSDNANIFFDFSSFLLMCFSKHILFHNVGLNKETKMFLFCESRFIATSMQGLSEKSEKIH